MNKFVSAWVPNAIYHVSIISIIRFRRRRFLKLFTIYGHGSHLGHVTSAVLIIVGPICLMKAEYIIWRQSVEWLQGKICFKLLKYEWPWQRSKNGLDLWYMYLQCSHLVHYIDKRLYHRLRYFLKNPTVKLFLIHMYQERKLTSV